MPERNPIDKKDSQAQGLRCEQWECLAPDALEGTLPAADLAAFEQHSRECAACAQLLKEARQGIAWLGYLESDPEVPGDLLAKILGRAPGSMAGSPALPIGIAPPSAAWAPAWHRTALPMARRVMEPRRLMTAAMAFFSIALTLNLTGVRFSQVRLADLRPSALGDNLVRQYYFVKEQGVKYYDNLRFVYELEAQVRELRQAASPPPNYPAFHPQNAIAEFTQ